MDAKGGLAFLHFDRKALIDLPRSAHTVIKPGRAGIRMVTVAPHVPNVERTESLHLCVLGAWYDISGAHRHGGGFLIDNCVARILVGSMIVIILARLLQLKLKTMSTVGIE